jgi:hypothetical protein
MVIQRMEPADKPDPADPLVFKGTRLVPMLDKILQADKPYMLYFAVYPDQSNTEQPVAQIEVSSGGKVVGTVPAKLIEDAGVWRALAGAPSKPGSYQFKVTASQGSLPSTTQALEYTAK